MLVKQNACGKVFVIIRDVSFVYRHRSNRGVLFDEVVLPLKEEHS
jgi:hypothetical protein